jgi:hypothetical protein
VRDCPGHWVLRGDPETGDMTWEEGNMAPEDAILQDFLGQIREHQQKRGVVRSES